MRRVLLAAAMFAMAASAQAADMPDFLRGPVGGYIPVNSWQGFYVGGQGGYGSSDEHFSGANTSMLSSLIANNVIQQMGVAQWNLQLGGVSERSSGYGAFMGYNWQWDDVVVGLEGSYLHGSFGGTTSATAGPLIGGPLSDNMYHAVAVNSADSIAISDMATFRARAGYAYGIFLPYVFGGLALGNANISQSVDVHDQYGPTFANAAASCTSATPPLVCYSLHADNTLHNHLIYGYSAGLGVDIKLIGGLFMRGEWEYARFVNQIEVNMNTVRAGLGYKF
jgi:opacity protein-like surface antigen